MQAGVSKWEKVDMDAICDHVIAGETATGYIANPYTFIIRLVGGKYQAISATGTLTYGGTDDEGSVDGDSFHDVLEAAVTGCGSYGTVRAVGNCHMDESYTLNAATAGAVSIYFDNLFLDNNTDGFIVTHATGGVWIGRLVGNSINYPSGYTATVITLKNVRYGHVDIDWIAPTSGIGDVGSMAVDIQADGGDNYKNYIRFGNLSQCYYGMRMYASAGYGNYFNTIHCGAIENSYTGLELRSDGAGSYVNANKFYNFDIREMTTRGKYGVLMYATNGTDGANGNDFYSFSISNLGDATDYGYYVDGEDNDFFGARTVDFSGDAIDVYQLDGDNYFIGGQFSHGNIQCAAGTLNIANTRGYKLENSGTCSIAAGTSVEVTHGLGSTYAGITPDEVIVMPRTGGQGEYIVTARDATTFTLTTVETGSFNFDWYARAKFPL